MTDQPSTEERIALALERIAERLDALAELLAVKTPEERAQLATEAELRERLERAKQRLTP